MHANRYLVRFETDDERIGLYKFFLENGFFLERKHPTKPKTISKSIARYPLKNFNQCVIDTLTGDLRPKPSWDTWKDYNQINRSEPPAFFINLVKSYYKNINISKPITLNGQKIG